MNHVSTLDLHRLRYGELDRERSAELRTHIDGCEACASRLRAQQAVRAEFEVLPVPPAIKEAASRPRGLPRWVWAVVPALAMAALAFLVILPGTFSSDQTDDVGTDDVRYKSAGRVEVLLEGRGVVDPSSTTFAAGDRIQIRIAPGPWTHAWITDGETVLGSFEVEPGRATLAPFSLEVDAAPEDERIVVVVAKEVLDDARIQKAIGGGRVAGADVTSVELRKRR